MMWAPQSLRPTRSRVLLPVVARLPLCRLTLAVGATLEPRPYWILTRYEPPLTHAPADLLEPDADAGLKPAAAGHQHGMLLETITDAAAFRGLAGEWDEALRVSGQNSPFLTHARLAAWLEVYGNDAALHVTTCRDETGQLIGALPSYVRRQGRFPRSQTLRLLGDEGIGAAGLSAFARSGVEAQVFGKLSDYVGGSRDWDRVDFNYMEPECEFFAHMLLQPRTHVVEHSDYCPRIELPESWDAYLHSLTHNARHNIKRTTRRIEERGIELERVNDAHALPAALDDLIRLQELRLKEKFGAEYSLPDAYREFTSRALRDTLASGSLRLWFFRLEGQRIAVFHAFRYGDTMYADRTGFDGNASAQNILRPLWATAIRSAIEEGCSAFDTMNGAFAYKSEWGARPKVLARVISYQATAAGFARAAMDRAKLLVADRPGRATGSDPREHYEREA